MAATATSTWISRISSTGTPEDPFPQLGSPGTATSVISLAGDTSVSASGNQSIDGLLSGIKWDSNNLTYSFPTSGSFYGYAGEPNTNFGALDATMQSFAQKALGNAAGVSGLAFTLLTESATTHADIRFGKTDATNPAHAYYPSFAAQGGDVWFNNSGGDFNNPTIGSYAYHAYLHELGHALGLKHGHEAGTFGALPVASDSPEFTVMTYRSYVGSPTDFYRVTEGSYPQSYMLNDIMALQYMYGADYTANAGNSTYSWSPTTGEMSIDGTGQGTPLANKVFLTIWDGGGTDTYDLSAYTTNLVIDLTPGAWSTFASAQLADLNNQQPGQTLARGNVANAHLFQGNTASLIENAIGGTGHDNFTGNSADNVFTGNGGDDVLHGLGGNDTFYGGDGLDVADYSETGANIVLFWANVGSTLTIAGTDTIAGIEGIGGGSGNDVFVGTAATNVFYGNAGNDYLYGQGGTDYGYGGSGGDVLLGESGDDTLRGGDDTDYVYGGDGVDALFGEAGVDIIAGGNGADTLDGGDGIDYVYGGAGIDTITGGNGNDIMVALGEADGDIFYAGAGNDYAYASDGADILYGGGDVDVLLGYGAADTIDGGTGIDYVWGGAGDDRFYVTAANGYLVINDFIAGAGSDDKVRLVGTALNSFGQVQAAMTYVGGINTTIVTVDADTNIWLIGIAPGQLTADDFLYA